MATVSVSEDAKPLDIVTICKSDEWVDTVLPRFGTLIDNACSGVVRRHLLLLVDAASMPSVEGQIVRRLIAQGWHTVVCKPMPECRSNHRLLVFDELRAGLLTEFGLREALYMDPDTDVVADLQGIQWIAPEAELLWVANPLLLDPVLADLCRYGFTPAGGRQQPVLMEPGFIYLRRDLSVAFADVRERFPQVNEFVPGSTYWNIVMLELGSQAVRLSDDYNRTFWDVPSAVTRARSVHFTGQWKRLQPFLEYDRPGRRILIRPERVVSTGPQDGPTPKSLAVVAMFRDNASYLPHAFSRFEAWERAGLPIRYYFLENDSVDATAALLAEFMRGRRGRLESRRLAVRYDRRRGSQHHDRIMPLARMRNFIVDTAMADSQCTEHEWTLLLDSEIFFPVDVLGRMFLSRSLDPNPESIGMLTCYTQQLFSPQAAPGATVPCPDMPNWAIADHYFDTFAFQDAGHRHHHPFCAFARCRRCGPSRPPGHRQHLIPSTAAIVEVAAAFGGLALVPTSILRDPRIRWTTYGSGFEQEQMLAEHVVLCDRLRTITGRRVVVLQDVDCVYRH